jgi:Tfp pilus assembly protein PilX
MFNALVKRKRPEDDSGMALVVCLLIMVVMAMIGIGVTMDSTLEIKISGNYKDKAVSFQNADAGLSASPEIIEDNLDNTRSVEPYTYSDDNKVPVIKVNSKALPICQLIFPSRYPLLLRLNLLVLQVPGSVKFR